jgi:tetratricopeptide (TPR) repeat protein
MDQNIVLQSRAEVKKAVEALKQGDNDAASNHFWNALNCLADIEDDRVRRDELGPLSLYYMNLGLFDLTIIGAREAIAIDKKLGKHRQLAKDMITLGNAELKLGQVNEAAQHYKNVLQLSLDHDDYENAASASTNLASLLADKGHMQDAIELLRNSLEYLKKKAFPNTEKITRLMLIQALGSEKESPEELISVAEILLKRFGNDISQREIEAIRSHIDNAVKEYLKANPDIHPLKWRLAHFPRLY